MAIKARGELLSLTDKVALTATFYDGLGNLSDTATFPKISIIQPSGNVLFTLSSVGVQRMSLGKYSYTYEIPFGGSLGVYNDIWQGNIDGYTQTQTLSFVVFDSDLSGVVSIDGYHQLGEDPGFHYSQTAILNINKLMKSVKARLNSSGKIQTIDDNGNTVYSDCDIFSVDTLTTFLASSLSEFNAIPHFSNINFEHTSMIDLFHYIIVEGAVIYAMASQSLVERGREWSVSDSGISVTIPTVSELLNSQYSQMYTTHLEKLRQIKASMKPGAIGLGNLTSTTGSPLARRLSTLRARRLF